MRSAFHGAGRDALDDVFLAAEVEDDDGDDAQEDERHRRAEIDRAVAALEVLDMDGNGLVGQSCLAILLSYHSAKHCANGTVGVLDGEIERNLVLTFYRVLRVLNFEF